MMNRNIADELRDNALHLRNTRNAVIGRGGTIAPEAGWKDVPEAVLFIPNDASIAIAATESNSYKVPVPTNSQSVARIDSVSGMTRVVSTNLFEDASKGGMEWNVRVNQQEKYFAQLLPAGKYRAFYKCLPAFEDDVTSIGYGIELSSVNYTGYGNGLSNGQYFEITEPMYVNPWCGAHTTGDPSIISVTQTGGTEPGEISLNEEKIIWIGEANADGSPSFCTISINTNTRVKVTVSNQFENQQETEFVVGKGEYDFYWANINNFDISVSIKIEQYSPEYVEAIFYPMVYAVPDDSAEHILTEYVPYYERLVPTAVTEIVSQGANLAVCTTGGTGSNKGISVTRESGKSSVVVNGEATEDTSVKLFGNFKLKAGTYTASVYGLNATDRLYLGIVGTTSVIVNNIKQNTSQRFIITEEKECFLQLVCASGSAYSNTKVEAMVNPYPAEPIDTVAIPDVVKSDASWGNGFSYTRDGVTSFVANEYDFNAKEYTRYIPEKVILDGTEGKKFKGASPVGIPRFYFPLIANCKDFCSVIATNFETNYSNKVGNVYLVNNNAYFFLPSNITTVTAANNWLKENPVEMVYALAEPIVTPIDEATEKYINVEGGGEIVLENDAKAAVPSTISFIRRI